MAATTANTSGTGGPATSMRLASSDVHPELCDLQYVINGEDGRNSPLKWLSIALIGISASLPTNPQWYDFAAFCQHNNLEIGEAGPVVGMEVRYGEATFNVHDDTSWCTMLTRVDELLQQQREQRVPAQLSILEIRPRKMQPDVTSQNNPPQQGQFPDVMELDQFQLEQRRLGAYRWEELNPRPSQNTDLDAEGEDDEWAACCEFMLHPYNERAPDDGKVLLGTSSAISPAEMLGAYRFLSRVAMGGGGTVVQTIGQLGTLRTQLAVTCTLRLVVLCKQHYLQNQQQHQPSGSDASAQATCGANNPFGIQCVCRPGTIAHRLASVVGNTRRPFIYLVKWEAIERCHEVMIAFFLRHITVPSRYPMLAPLIYLDPNPQEPLPPASDLPALHRIMRYILSGEGQMPEPRIADGRDRNQFIILLDTERVATILAPPQALGPNKQSWLWRACCPLCTSVLDWRFPRPGDAGGIMAAEAVIKWVTRMRFATDGEPGLVSITTPGEVLHRDELGSCRNLLLAIAPSPRRSRRRWQRREIPAARYRRYGFVPPCEPDVSVRFGTGSVPGGPQPSPAVTVEYMLLRTRPTLELLAGGPPPSAPPGTRDPSPARDLAQNLQSGSADATLTVRTSNWLSQGAAQALNAVELLHFTPDTFPEALQLIMHPEVSPAPLPLVARVLNESPAVQLLLRVIMDVAGGATSILVLANNEAMARSIANYINERNLAGIAAANILSSGWLATGRVPTTHEEAEVRMQATAPRNGRKVVIVAGPEAMDSGWLSMGYVNCCVVFGAPFSPLPLKSMLQAVCGNGEPRDVRIIHIGVAGDTGASLNGLMRSLCMEQPSYGLGING